MCGTPSDVYAFGALTVVVLKESALWPGLNFSQIMQKVTNNEHPSVDGLIEGVKAICISCFSEVASRPNIEQVLKCLQKIICHS